MLILSRDSQQGFSIGDNVHVRVLSIGENYVRLGIDAPRTLPILRDELPANLRDAYRERAEHSQQDVAK